jgi:hypothetical protein
LWDDVLDTARVNFSLPDSSATDRAEYHVFIGVTWIDRDQVPAENGIDLFL